MDQSNIKSQIRSGFRTVGNVLLGITVAFLFFSSAALLWFPERTRPDSLASTHPLALGIVLLVAAITILTIKMNSWVTVLPGILGYGVIGGLFAIATGHLSPSAPISRLDASIATFLIGIASAVSRTFATRELNFADRIGLLTFALVGGLGACYDAFQNSGVGTNVHHTVLFVTLGIATSVLVLAWIRGRAVSQNPSHSTP